MAYLADTNVIVRWLLPHDPLAPPAVRAIDILRAQGEVNTDDFQRYAGIVVVDPREVAG